MIDATAPDARRARILKRIQQEGRVSLADLASEHAVSAVTVHRDLQLLSEEGLLQRVRGGARSLAEASARIETGWNARLREAAPEKDAIAAADALQQPLAREQLEVAVDGDRRDGVLGRQLRERSPAVALDALEDPRAPEHRRQRGVDHRRAIADSVSASNRWTRSRSTAARTVSPTL